MIPFVDLKQQYLNIKDEIDEAIKRVISNSSYIGGQEVKSFEMNFASWLGVDFFVSCANGTDSIEILLRAMEIGPGDEVIVPAMSWISTSEAVSTCGAKPVFVDILEDYYTINEDRIEAAISPRTKAIIPVHLYGQPCNMTKIMNIAEKYGLKVIEDCAQAHGTRWEGQRVGTFGHAASFSFFPGKNLGAYGDAGGMATNDSDLARVIRMIANHGQEGKHNHIIEGRNSRLDGLQAAILNVKLKYLDGWIKDRIAVSKNYSVLMRNDNIILPKTREGGEHSFHLFVIQIKGRDKIKSILHSFGIETAVHYPTPLPYLNCYAEQLPSNLEFNVSKSFSTRILSLPIYAELCDTDVNLICNILNDF